MRAVSNVTEAGLLWWSSCVARSAAAESSGCMRMKDMPDLDQSVFRKVGRELS